MTGTEIITIAYKKIGAYTTANPVTPEALVDGMNELNGWLHFITTRGIAIPFITLSVPGDELEEPMDCTNAITDNLAINLATFFDNGNAVNVSPTLTRNAAAGMRMLWNDYGSFIIPDKGVSSTLPLGQGWKYYRYWRTFKGRDGTVGN